MRWGLLAPALLCLAAPAAGEPARFVSVVEDLPLPAALEEVSADPFETPQGRIVRIEAEGAATKADIERFYLDTLPALGWRAAPESVGAGALAFERGGERLALRVERAPEGGVRATITITPAG